MIPLGQWLSDERGEEPAPRTDEMSAVTAPEPESVAQETAAYERGRAEALVEAETQWKKTLAESEIASRQLARAELQRWADSTATQFQESMDAAFCKLRQAIESSLVEILRPFLVQQVLDRSVASLIGMLDDDMARHGEPLLEVRAPSLLRDPVALALEGRCSTVTTGSDTRIDVIYRHQAARFETLEMTMRQDCADR